MKKQIILKTFILKILLINTLFSVYLFAASLSPIEITNMVSEIKKKRKGISLLKLESTEQPFLIRIPKKEEIEEIREKLEVLKVIEVVYTLKAILNKAAFIDNKWYKQGDSIGEYTVGYVSSHSVVLRSESTTKTLSLKKKKKSFIKLNRGYR